MPSAVVRRRRRSILTRVVTLIVAVKATADEGAGSREMEDAAIAEAERHIRPLDGYWSSLDVLDFEESNDDSITTLYVVKGYPLT